jgi:hypothetical protein
MANADIESIEMRPHCQLDDTGQRLPQPHSSSL